MSQQKKLLMEFGKYFIEMYFWDTLMKKILEIKKNQPG